MFKSLLVANRGEIACRIFRTARAMGMRTIAVYSDADAKAKHVREADEAVHIGASPAAESYLRGEKILDAAKRTGAEAIHPGYGFLSENPDFAQAVIDAGLIWVGPTPAAIRAMGLKDEAKRIAIEAGVPVLDGYQGEDQSEKRLLKAARDIGFPVLIKAVAGGGGRGIREVKGADDFKAQLESAQREAQAAFGDARVLIEKLVERPRHIEVQVFGDKHGALVHLFERDCSLQRRRQKVIEEAPAPGMTEEVRAAMTEAALKVARAVKYENAGTVEFIVDGNGPLRPDGFWFLEMNTRLQVEHPVTEAITGLDLVDWQLRVAAGEKLPLQQDEITLTGHAIEARICAEDPSEGFRPSVGKIQRFDFGVVPDRIDAGFIEGDVVPSAYDSLIAKLVCWGSHRYDAISALSDQLAGLRIFGITTNAAFLRHCAMDEAFSTGQVHTGVIAESEAGLVSRAANKRRAALLSAVHDFAEPKENSPWGLSDGWRLNGARSGSWRFEHGDEALLVFLYTKGDRSLADVGGERFELADVGCKGADVWAYLGDAPIEAHVERTAYGRIVFLNGDAFAFQEPGASREHADGAASDEIKAPLPGKIVAVSAQKCANVKKGDALLTLEAMKMEHQLKAPRDGVIAAVNAETGAQVKEGAVLISLEPEA